MPSLSRAEAVQRAILLRVASYDIDLDLSGAESFESLTRVSFTCTEPGGSTFVELRPRTLLEATLNGVWIDPATLDDNRLPLSGLAVENELVVRARMEYSHSGEGLHRFVDPEDGGTYLYAQSFLDDAQRIFACFDQPDLKATFRLRVSAPVEWEVAGNGTEVRVAPGRWELDPTPPISTYLVTLLAGPYHVRRDEHDGIPLALYCRRALAPHLDKDAEELFGFTKRFLDRYHELFGVRYPFVKYGQAFVPEFNAGAMENPGLVTLRDEYLFRSAVTDVERELRAVTIAHEMAHMWFGDLVTMRWWDDIWLNESFAEYMGFRLVAEVTRFRNAWTGYAVARKSWGAIADQRPSTHPVAPESIVDTAHAMLNFDGISYAKGASVLRQLVTWLGDGVFVAGLRAYFARHAFNNATLADLLAALGLAAKRDLGDWADLWLRRPQINTLRAEVSYGPAGDFDTVHIVQTAPAAEPTLRPHRLGVAVYDHGTRRHQFMVDVDPVPRTAVPALTGVTSGELLLVNDGDLTYAKVRLDPDSAARVVSTLPALQDSLARAVVWASTIDSVRDAELPVSSFVALFEAALPSETELSLVRDITRFATTRAAEATFPHAGLVGRYARPEDLPSFEARIAAACLARLESAPAGSGLALAAARGYVASTRAEPLRAWLANGPPAGLDLDVELRWAVLSRLAALGALSEAEIDAAAAADHTASGAVHAARCRASLPDPAAKGRAWRLLFGDDQASNRLVGATADGFWQPLQPAFDDYVARYFEEMPALATRRSPAIVGQIGTSAFPRYAVSAATVELAEAMLARPDVEPVLRRIVVDATDELSRALASRGLSASGSSLGSGSFLGPDSGSPARERGQ